MEESKEIIPVNNGAVGEVKKINAKLPKALKNFFFTEMLADPAFQESEKQLGCRIATVAIIITHKKTFMRTTGENGQDVDTDMTEEERQKMFKTFRVKEKVYQECKNIFFLLDIKKMSAHIRQKKFDGSIKEITL